jgi:hypothetical protein
VCVCVCVCVSQQGPCWDPCPTVGPCGETTRRAGRRERRARAPTIYTIYILLYTCRYVEGYIEGYIAGYICVVDGPRRAPRPPPVPLALSLSSIRKAPGTVVLGGCADVKKTRLGASGNTVLRRRECRRVCPLSHSRG